MGGCECSNSGQRPEARSRLLFDMVPAVAQSGAEAVHESSSNVATTDTQMSQQRIFVSVLLPASEGGRNGTTEIQMKGAANRTSSGASTQPPQHESGDPRPRFDAPPESLGGTIHFHRRGNHAHAAPCPLLAWLAFRTRARQHCARHCARTAPKTNGRTAGSGDEK